MRSFCVAILIFSLVACSKKQEGDNTQTQESPAASPSVAESTTDTSQDISQIEDPARTEWQNPDFVLDELGDLSQKTVVDIGAGSGYFSFKLSQRAKKVIALDIDPRALEYIEEQKEIVGDWSANIETRLTPPDVPNLVEAEADVVLIVNTYGFIPERSNYLTRLLNGIADGGQLVIIDFKSGDIPVGPSDEFKQDPKSVVRELRNVGFKRVKRNEESLQYQFIITAEK